MLSDKMAGTRFTEQVFQNVSVERKCGWVLTKLMETDIIVRGQQRVAEKTAKDRTLEYTNTNVNLTLP